MMNAVTATAEELLQQASWTAADYLSGGIEAIDKKFGEGYAKKHPELLGAFMAAASRDLQTSLTVQALQEVARNLEALSEIKDIARALRDRNEVMA